MKRLSFLAAVSLSAVMATATPKGEKPESAPRDMDTFITELMSKMTVEEKIGQLNLPVTGEIVTGQAKSSDVAKLIEQGLVGGLFNLKGVDRIRDVQKLAVENSRLGIPLLFGMDVIHGYETVFPIPLGPVLQLEHGSRGAVGAHCGHRGQCRRHLLDLQPDGGRLPRPALGTCQRRQR